MRWQLSAGRALLALTLIAAAAGAYILASSPPAPARAAPEAGITALPLLELALNLPLVFGGSSPGATATATTTATPTTTATAEPTVRPPSELQWEAGAAASRGLYEAQGMALGGKLYVFGGYYNSQIQATAESFAYDPQANAWTRLADMPQPVTHAGVAADGALIYIAGGFLGNHPGPDTDAVWIYDTGTNTWRPGPTLPAGRAGGALVRLGRTLHFFGGTSRTAAGVYEADYADHWALDLDGAGTWQPLAPMPNPRNHMAGAVLGGKIYAVGGQHLADEFDGNQRSVDVYDPQSNTWTAAADLPLPLGHIQSSTFDWDGRLVVASGITTGKVVMPDVFIYDPQSDRWGNLTPLPQAYQSPVAGIIDGAIVLSGGAHTWLGTPR